MAKDTRVLLDTHALVWWLIGSRSLSAKARKLINNPDIEVYVSAATGWEIATKVRIGKLQEMEKLSSRLTEIIIEQDFSFLPITFTQAHLAGSFQSIHRDPFDRVLAAQAIDEKMPIVSDDGELVKLGAVRIW